MIIDFDKVLERVGEFKRYQISHYVMLGVASIPVGMHTLANVFLAATPNHWCIEPQIANFSHQERHGAIPLDSSIDRIHDECTVFDASSRLSNYSFGSATNGASPTACREWNFDRNTYESTITSEWSLVCSEAWKPVMAQSIFMTGFLLGAILFGALSDWIGRKLSWYIGLLAVFITGCLAAFMPEYWSHVILRAVSGAACAGYYTVAFVLSLETTGKDYRVKTGMMYQAFFAVGYMILAATAYFIRNYVWLQLAISITPAAFLIFYCFIGESPRWLITQGRLVQARHELRRIARMNNSEYVDDILENEIDYLVKMSQVGGLFRLVFITLPVIYLLYLAYDDQLFDVNLRKTTYVDVNTYSRPRYVQTHNRVWQVVQERVGVRLFSAFYDNRYDQDLPVIRTIAVVKNGSDDGLRCLLWLPGIARPLVTNATSLAIGAWFQPHLHGVFRAVLLSCVVHADTGYPTPIPEHVSIMTSQQTTPTTLLPVQVPETPARPLAFGHCMSVAYWHQDPYRIVEWMELHRMWGVEEVTVYACNLHSMSTRVYKHYASKGFVDMRTAPKAINTHRDDEEAILLNMSPVLNDCMYRNLYRYRRLVVTDIDEMIVPQKHDNYAAMLHAIETKAFEETYANHTNAAHVTSVDKRKANFSSYTFNNVYFFTDLNVTRQKPWFLTTQRYFKHIIPSPPGYAVKSIHNPLACVGLQNHVCWVYHARAKHGSSRLNVPLSIGVNHHYKKCHFDEYLEKNGMCKHLMKHASVDFTMMRFRRELKTRVLAVLKELDLVESD